jgi:hypothetical protein
MSMHVNSPCNLRQQPQDRLPSWVRTNARGAAGKKRETRRDTSNRRQPLVLDRPGGREPHSIDASPLPNRFGAGAGTF